MEEAQTRVQPNPGHHDRQVLLNASESPKTDAESTGTRVGPELKSTYNHRPTSSTACDGRIAVQVNDTTHCKSPDARGGGPLQHLSTGRTTAVGRAPKQEHGQHGQPRGFGLTRRSAKRPPQRPRETSQTKPGSTRRDA